MIKILQLTWLISLIVPFLLLDWKWAILVLFINFIGILPLGIVVISILKPIFGPGHWFLNFSTGASESIFYLLINRFLSHPDKFLLALVVVYFINQIGRSARAGFKLDELLTLIGFFSMLGLSYLFGWI